MLRTLTGDDALVDAVLDDWRSAPLEASERAMLTYADKLTRDCAAVSTADLDALRAAGFDDQGILQINLITAMFGYFNRIADGLGVGRE